MDNLRTSAVRVQPEIAAVMSQVQQRRVQLHRQPSGPAPAPRSVPAPAAAPVPPAAASVYGNLPPELQQKGHFCLWRYESRPNTPKPAKVPYDPRTGARASVADPSTFASFGETLQRLTTQYNGIGIRIADGIGALDLDNAIDANKSEAKRS